MSHSQEEQACAVFVVLLAKAEELEYRYPLHVTLAAADGQAMAFEIPAKGQPPAIVKSLDPDSPTLKPPYIICIHESDPGGRTIHARVAGKIVDGALELDIHMQGTESAEGVWPA